MLFLFGSEILNLADLSRSASHLIIIWLMVHQLIEAGGREDFGVGMLPYCVQYLRSPKLLVDRGGQISRRCHTQRLPPLGDNFMRPKLGLIFS